MDEDDAEARPVDDSETVTTHISLLVLTGDRVLKFRRPVVTDFCDFSTIGSRLHDCEREVELNRRLTDDVYLGVGRVQFAEEDPDRAEPCVVMRRLPAGRLLSSLVAAGEDIDQQVRAIAAQLAGFHTDAVRIEATGTDDGVRAVQERWTDAIEQVRPHTHDPAAIAEIEELVTRWCAGREPLFRERLADGFVRDGHGDLRAQNIFCLDDGPRILDCIEFDDDLRRIDVATDLAFLVMDLRRLGRATAAATLLDVYERGVDTPIPRGLVDHDAAYWALVRAKVTHLRASQGDPDAADQARELETLALDGLRRSRVRLVVVGGLPGTGKSTLSHDLAATTGWEVVSSDVVRKELADLPASARTGDDHGAGLYHPARTAATYDEVLRRARHLLERGQSVILDASWSRSSDRVDAASMARATEAELHEIRCTLDAEEARNRLIARAREGTDASDAGPAVARQMASTFEPWPSARPIDTSGATEAITALVRTMLGVDAHHR